MKKKLPKQKPLSLHKETLRQLIEPEMKHADGGIRSAPTCAGMIGATVCTVEN
jgi:hypothetical protein